MKWGKGIVFLVGVVFCIACTHSYQPIPKELLDKKLFVHALNNKIIDTQSKAYIVLEKNHFRGFSGCNDFNGTFEIVDKKTIHFTLDDTGTKVCKYLPLQHQFLENLVQTKSILVKKKRVYYKDDNKDLITFEEAP